MEYRGPSLNFGTQFSQNQAFNFNFNQLWRINYFPDFKLLHYKPGWLGGWLAKQGARL